MTSYKEIVTKTVIGKAKKTSKDNVIIKPEQIPSTILGCWIINHEFKGTNNGGKVNLSGSFDVNVWYSYDSDHLTAVTTKTYTYTDSMDINIKGSAGPDTESEIIVHSLKQPTVSNAKIKDQMIELDIEKELGVEVVGEAKIKVSIEDVADDYDEIIDDSEVDKIVDQVDAEYLN